MNMIGIVNEAINKKLNSISFTNIIIGTVESVKPLQIRINSRILIGQSFIEPMSLGISDYSPGSALPLVVGEKIQMIRYNNGQRFYILGKSAGSGVVKVDYDAQVYNKPSLDTTSNKSLNPLKEEINGTISLHRIAKTGSYADVYNKPKLNTNNDTTQTVGEEEINGVINLHKVAKTGSYNDLSDKPDISDNLVTTDTEQTISAKKTFTILPECSMVPTSANQFVNKNYIDTNFLQFDVIENF